MHDDRDYATARTRNQGFFGSRVRGELVHFPGCNREVDNVYGNDTSGFEVFMERLQSE